MIKRTVVQAGLNLAKCGGRRPKRRARRTGCRRGVCRRRISPTEANLWWHGLSLTGQSFVCWAVRSLQNAGAGEAKRVAESIQGLGKDF